jgi:hypothetical protein
VLVAVVHNLGFASCMHVLLGEPISMHLCFVWRWAADVYRDLQERNEDLSLRIAPQRA